MVSLEANPSLVPAIPSGKRADMDEREDIGKGAMLVVVVD